MSFILQNNEPMAVVNNMDSYFKQKPPDCVLVSKENFKVPVHKELFYQTEFMRSMIKSVGFENCCSSIEIIFPSLCFDNLEVIVQFLYNGKVSTEHQGFASQISSHLVTVFGFSSVKVEEVPKTEMEEELKIDTRDEPKIKIEENAKVAEEGKIEIETEEDFIFETGLELKVDIEETPAKKLEDSRPKKRSRKQSFVTKDIKEEIDFINEMRQMAETIAKRVSFLKYLSFLFAFQNNF